MPTLHFVPHPSSADSPTIDVPARVGRSVMQAAVDAGLPQIAADCGGTLTCATCHVIVSPEWLDRLPPMSPDEDTMLDFTASPRQAGSRLCCQLNVTESLDGLTLHLPEHQ
jgi:2Fe-2S ferredoxin